MLPSPKNHLKVFFLSLLQKVTGLFVSKRSKYKLAAVIDLTLIVLILLNGRAPVGRMITPLVSSVKTYYSINQHRSTKESFAFVPGLARNKFSDVDLVGLANLSFFDVPVTDQGELNRDSRGYASFTSDEAAGLFERARFQKTKVFLTLSATSFDIVKSILDDEEAVSRLAEGAAEEVAATNIDGITVDFEFAGNKGKNYQEKFTNFVGDFTKRIHTVSSKTLVAVALPSTRINNDSLYNVENLGRVSDRLFLIASDFIVPEVQDAVPSNPLYGYSRDEYWSNISKLLGTLQKRIPENKLVMERAWYGNGNNYPLYVPKSGSSSDNNEEASPVQLDQWNMEILLAGVPAKGKSAAERNIPLIAQALQNEGILDSNVLAYALATVEHETDETFEPIGEIQGTLNARRLGYEGGANYFGRGFIQITHLRNYRLIGERIGMGDQLVKNPNLASDPRIAAKVLAAFFKDNNVANLASRGNFVAARVPINPDYNCYSVANLAMKYEL